MVAPQGFEPRYAAPEAAVLPLNEGAMPRQKKIGGAPNLFIVKAQRTPVNATTGSPLPGARSALNAWTRPAALDDRRNAAAGPELPLDDGLYRVAGLHHILQHLIDDVLLKDSEIAIGEQIFLHRLQFEAAVARHVTHRVRAKVGETGLWTDRGEFRVVNQNLATRELILPRFNGGEVAIETSSGMLVGVT